MMIVSKADDRLTISLIDSSSMSEFPDMSEITFKDEK